MASSLHGPDAEPTTLSVVHGAADAPKFTAPLQTPLGGEQLLALQLHARGYPPEQIARLVGRPTAEVGTLLALAARRFGAGDFAGAVREARRRGLIV